MPHKTGATALITLQDAERSLKFLLLCDSEFGRRRACADGLKETRKIVKAEMMLQVKAIHPELPGPMVEAKARVSNQYKQEVEDLTDAIRSYEIMKAKRLTHELRIEMWRSINSAQNKGNI